MAWKEDRGVLWAFDETARILEIAKAEDGDGTMPDYFEIQSHKEWVHFEESEKVNYEPFGGYDNIVEVTEKSTRP